MGEDGCAMCILKFQSGTNALMLGLKFGSGRRKASMCHIGRSIV